MLTLLRAWNRRRQDRRDYEGLLALLARINAADVDAMDAAPIAFDGGQPIKAR